MLSCTIGDLLIGALTTVLGAGYTFVSEWMNTSLTAAWQYSALMPTLAFNRVVIGLFPLAQWLLIPPLALYLARRRRVLNA